MERYICVTCGTQFADSAEPPDSCPICEDPRQYVPPSGQRWTTLAELGADHDNDIRADGELIGIGTSPSFAIGQRALLVPFGDSNLLWDCITLLDEATAAEVESRGGYARTVVGRLAYFDDEAQTYMVLTRDGMLVRVPLRDITSSHGVPRVGPIVADALSKMSRLRNATTVSRP